MPLCWRSTHEDNYMVNPQQKKRQARELPQDAPACVGIVPLELEVDEHASNAGEVDYDRGSNVHQSCLADPRPRGVASSKKDRLHHASQPSRRFQRRPRENVHGPGLLPTQWAQGDPGGHGEEESADPWRYGRGGTRRAESRTQLPGIDRDQDNSVCSRTMLLPEC